MIVIQKRQKTLEPVTVRGKVLDEKGMTLPGATVIVKGTSIGGSTNDQGMFVFSLPKMDTIYLLVSSWEWKPEKSGLQILIRKWWCA